MINPKGKNSKIHLKTRNLLTEAKIKVKQMGNLKKMQIKHKI